MVSVAPTISGAYKCMGSSFCVFPFKLCHAGKPGDLAYLLCEMRIRIAVLAACESCVARGMAM